MRKLTAATILTATAAVLAFRPSREWIGDAMIDAGIRLAYGEPPPMRERPAPKADDGWDDFRAWCRARNVTRIDDEALARLDAEIAKSRPSTRRNGDSPV